MLRKVRRMAERQTSQEDFELNEERDEYDDVQTKDIRRIVGRELSNCNQQLSDALYNSLSTFSSLMLEHEFITNHVHQKNQKFDAIMHDFKARLNWLNLDELRDHCIKFLSILTEVGGPAVKAAERLKKNWNTKVNKKHNITFLPTPLQEKSQSEPSFKVCNPPPAQKTNRSLSADSGRYFTPATTEYNDVGDSPTTVNTLSSVPEESPLEFPIPLSTHDAKQEVSTRGQTAMIGTLAPQSDPTGPSDQHFSYETKNLPETKKESGVRSEDMPVLKVNSLPQGPVVFNTDLKVKPPPHTDPIGLGPHQESSFQHPPPTGPSPVDNIWNRSRQNSVDPTYEILTEVRELKSMFQNEKEENDKSFKTKLQADIRELKANSDKKHDEILERGRKLSEQESELETQRRLLNIQGKRSDDRDKLLAEREESCAEKLKLIEKLLTDLKKICKEREQRLHNVEVKLQEKIDQFGKELETRVRNLKEKEVEIMERIRTLQGQERQQYSEKSEQQYKQMLKEFERHGKEIDSKHTTWKEKLMKEFERRDNDKHMSLKEELSKHFNTQQTQQDLLRQRQWLLVVIAVLIIVLIFMRWCSTN